MMTFSEAQKDMRHAYVDGATGVITSATVWLLAAITAWQATPNTAIATLLIGGMFIFPLSVALSKLLGRSGVHSKQNPLAPLATAVTLWMLLAIPIAYAASLHKIEWFFPAMLLTIGGRYLTFSTLYGLRIYDVCGATLSLAAIACVLLKMPIYIGAIAGALIEYIFGFLILLKARRGS
ncbi:hypothetical protein [Duganella sp. BuS-21]|uniref:DUF7010 family protein n=1 Tax=Duganella sp. BuS-21 TaxID=2943848 RepID=UPI0035A6B593